MSAKSNEAVQQLLNHETPWIRLMTASYIQPKKLDEKEKIKLQKEIIAHPLIKPLYDECQEWPGRPLTNHKDVKHVIHKLHFLIDIGVDQNISGMAKVMKKILSFQDDEGVLRSVIQIPKVFGGSDAPAKEWILCDFPVLLHMLLLCGYEKDKRVKKAEKKLFELVDDNGWRCHASIPKFKGPGNRKDPCQQKGQGPEEGG